MPRDIDTHDTTRPDPREMLLEVSPHASDGGALIGRDPRRVPAADWTALGAGGEIAVGLRAIRAKCLDCAGSAVEARKCVQTDCPLWPLRMGSQPRGLAAHRRAANTNHQHGRSLR